MVILDRVCCNFCHTYIGQVWSRPAESTDGLECLTLAPHFTLCPDCLDNSVIFQPLNLTQEHSI